jgi:prepilin-type N-terminal cleavage/methylation domain-containing protein
MLTQLLALTKAELKSKLQAIDASAIKGRVLRRKFNQIRGKKEGGFTLLELLVVVAILAAIAGTATIMLQDTDRRASAGAHVAMMDQLTKAIQEYRILNRNKYPDRWDSLMQGSSTDLSNANQLAILSADLLGSITSTSLDEDMASVLTEAGITKLRMVNTGAAACQDSDENDIAGASDQTGQQKIINAKTNDITAQNFYREKTANGCGFVDDSYVKDGANVMVWNYEGNHRVNAYVSGDIDPNGDGTTALTANDVLVAFGVGADSTLFDPTRYAALSHAPIYRHVEPDEYNRFIVLFKVSGVNVADKAIFQAIVDGAGDTKDEELGELDNVRPT